MNIPFSPPYIDKSIEEEVLSSLRSGWITSGPQVKSLEKFLEKTYDIPNTVACNSGTSALMLALHWFGVGNGDEVIIPAYTYAATALAVLHAGATPFMVDSGDDFNLNPYKIREAITERTKAIIPVDIGGWPCDYKLISGLLKDINFNPSNEIQKKLGRPLILADASHSIGGAYQNGKVGTLGDISVMSFHAVKNITTAEGGAICLNLPEPFNNSEIAKTLKLWTLNGQTKDAFTKSKAGGWKYDIVYPGFKMNLPDVLAAIGLAQLRIYESELLPKRREIFKCYNEAFSNYEWAQLPPFDNKEKKSSCHLYQLRIRHISEDQRDKIIEKITKKGVAVNVHFIPLPMLTIFKERGYDIKDYPVAYDNYSREISLPIYPQLSEEQVEYVIESVVKSVDEVLGRKVGGVPSFRRVREVPTHTSLSPKGDAHRTRVTNTMHFGADPILFKFARELRLNHTKAEEIIWERIKNRQLSGFKFRRQHPIDKYIADFYCHDLRMVIEIDGDYHNAEDQSKYDFNRDGEMEEYGIIVKRITNKEVIIDFENTFKALKDIASERAESFL